MFEKLKKLITPDKKHPLADEYPSYFSFDQIENEEMLKKKKKDTEELAERQKAVKKLLRGE